MSRYHKASHSTPARKIDPRLLRGLFVAAAVLIAVVIFTVAQGDKYVPKVQGAPAIEVEQEHFDYGDVKYGEMVETEFTVKNVGDETLVLQDSPVVEVVEGCCPPRAHISNMRLKPGEETTVHVQFSMHEGMGGPHLFNIHLESNDPAQAEKLLTIRSNWIP